MMSSFWRQSLGSPGARREPEWMGRYVAVEVLVVAIHHVGESADEVERNDDTCKIMFVEGVRR